MESCGDLPVGTVISLCSPRPSRQKMRAPGDWKRRLRPYGSSAICFTDSPSSPPRQTEQPMLHLATPMADAMFLEQEQCTAANHEAWKDRIQREALNDRIKHVLVNIAAKREPKDMSVNRKPEDVPPKYELVDIAAKREHKDMSVNRKPEDVPPKHELVDIAAKREPKDMSVNRKPEDVPPKYELVDIAAKRESKDMPLNRKPEDVSPKLETGNISVSRPRRVRNLPAHLRKFDCKIEEDEAETNVPVKRKRPKSQVKSSVKQAKLTPTFEMCNDGTIVVKNGKDENFLPYQPNMARIMAPAGARSREEQARRDRLNAACRMSRARAKEGATRPYKQRASKKQKVEEKIEVLKEEDPEI